MGFFPSTVGLEKNTWKFSDHPSMLSTYFFLKDDVFLLEMDRLGGQNITKNSTTWALQIDMFDHQLRDTVPLSSTPHMLFPPAFPLPPILQPGDPQFTPSFEALWAEQRVGQPSTVRPQQPKDDINMCQPSNSNSEPKKHNKTNNLATHITTVVSWTNFFGACLFCGDDPPGMDSESWWCFEPWWERWFFVEGYHLTRKIEKFGTTGTAWYLFVYVGKSHGNSMIFMEYL